MKNNNILLVFFLLSFLSIGFISSCDDKPITDCENCWNGWTYDPTSYSVNLPDGMPNATFLANIPEDNPLTQQGIALGRKLFYDPILSGDGTLSCAGCHNQSFGFTDDGKKFSVGIDLIEGKRNAMPVFNLGYQPLTTSLPPYDTIGFFWDGRAPTIEAQALRPIQDPIEMHEVLPNVVAKLSGLEIYQQMFFEAFGIKEITPEYVGKAIAQFERTIVSGNSKYDKATTPGSGVFFTDEEVLGYQLFGALDGGDCFHCHVIGGTFTDYTYRNNGLDDAAVYTDFIDAGLGDITGKPEDYGKFKVPSLRNVALTAPYMHDGRFATLEDVLEHYNAEVKDTPFTDPFMQFAFQGGIHLGPDSVAAIIAFLKTLTDSTLLTNPNFGPPDF